MDQTAAQIYESSDYSKFRLLESNRDVSERRKSKVKSSIRSIGYIKGEPITVNERMEIIDGQARFYACMELGIPVYYVIAPGSGERELGYLNSASTNWSTSDYINHFATRGVESYVYLNNMLKKYRVLGANTVINVTSDTARGAGNATLKYIKSGTYTVDASSRSEVEATLDFLVGIEPYVKKMQGKSEYAFSAIAWCFRHTAADLGRLKKTVQDCAVDKNGRPQSIATTAQALAIIEDRYNLGLRRGRIYFTAEFKEYHATRTSSYKAMHRRNHESTGRDEMD